MIIRNLFPRTLRWLTCAAILTSLAFLSACGSQTERDQANFEKDGAALTDVRRIQTSLLQSQIVQQADLDLLRSIYSRYPKSTEVRKTLQTALQSRQDWGALEKLLTEDSSSERSPQDQVFLAKVYTKLGKYQDASRIVGPMAEAAPNDLELNSIAGHAWYFQGKYDEAARAFDRIWDTIVAGKHVDDMTMRAMIYFYKGDKNRAIEILKETLKIDPESLAGNNALSRVYAANGDQLSAETYRALAEKAHARQTAEESRRMRVTSRSRDLESAFAGGRYDECIQIAREMLQYADEPIKPTLYDYLAKSYEATGRRTEAQTAAKEAATLRERMRS